MKQLCMITCIILLVLMSKVNLQAAKVDVGNPIASYVADNGLQIISYSENWQTEEQLKSVYEELLNNTHGNELAYLSAIYLYASTPTSATDGFGSFYHEDYDMNKIGQIVYGVNSYIEIYNTDDYTSIGQMARVLSHEYGHHFTFYYLMTKTNTTKEQWLYSEYAKIRHLGWYPEVTYLNQYPEGYTHEWDIAEILAEDYIQLYGSPLTRKSRDYYDVVERIMYNDAKANYVYSDFNVLPQENLELDLAADVSGLAEYLTKLSGIAPVKSIEKIEVKSPYLSKIDNVFKNFNQYTWLWPQVKIMEAKNQYEYTLLLNAKSNNDYPIPIKTCYTGEPLQAASGSCVDFKKGLAIMSNHEGDYEVRLFVKDRNGFMHSSDIVNLTITPRDNAKLIFLDVPEEHWGCDYIYDLTNRDMVKGYEGNLFRPEGTITKAEFMTFLIRTLKNKSLIIDERATHWFVKEGYLDLAQKTGLLTETNNNTTYFEETISREEMALMIYTYLKNAGKKVNITYKSKLTDVENSNQALQISVINYYQIITGYKDNTFKPQNNATRAEAMKMLSKYLTVIGQ